MILSDAYGVAFQPFLDGITEGYGEAFSCKVAQKSRKARGKFQNALIQSGFFLHPLRWYFRYRGFRTVVGWQQFFAINWVFWKKIFRARRRGMTVIVNFTYKKRGGKLVHNIYDRYMRWVLQSEHVDLIHVLSNAYAQEMAELLDVSIDKFLVIPFGRTDEKEEIMKLPRPLMEPYVLSVGRSNRDFDLLVDLWSQPELSGSTLVIIADMWHPKGKLPANVRHFDNVTGKDVMPWFAHAEASVVSVDNPNLCSGDTVLLTSMMLSKCTFITAPSTLAEMYVEDGVDGVFINRSAEEAIKIASKLSDKNELCRLGDNARLKFLNNYTLRTMGLNIGKAMRQYRDARSY